MKRTLAILIFLLLAVACSSEPDILPLEEAGTTATVIETADPTAEIIEEAATEVPEEVATEVVSVDESAETETNSEAAAEAPEPQSDEVPATDPASSDEEVTADSAEAEEDTPENSADAVVGDNVENIGTGRLFELPGDNIYPEGVSYNPANGKFYVGATSDGTLYEGDVNGDGVMAVFSEGGADGRTAAIGTKVDSAGNLWVAGGNTGQMWVYNTGDGALIAQYSTPADGSMFINDMAVTESGVYFTDSFRPIIWRITDLNGGEAEAWLDLTGSAINYVQGFNLNGIIATEDGNDLIVVHSGEGELYRINIATQAVTWIETGTIPLTAGDGLELIGQTLYVTRNNFGEIVAITLADDLSSGSGGDLITSDLFGYPTTIAFTGNSFLVANSQFNNRNAGTPDLPFTVAQIPVQVAEETTEAAPAADEASSSTSLTLRMDAWADNWFAAYIDDTLLVEDSVSITTERSFNAETITFDASFPLNLNFILKDFKENDTGLEYIGANNQQMGDGGFIMQLTDTSSGATVGVTNSAFTCLVIHEAPLDKACENESNPVVGTAPCDYVETAEPEGWKLPDFDDSAWSATTVHSSASVDPRQGYNQISWDSSAEFIWGPDLETNNTVLCRVMISGE